MKYESNLLDWQRVVEIGWCLLTKQDMGRFKEMCEEGLLGPRDYGLFEDWLAIDGSREGTSALGIGWFWREKSRR